MLKCPGCGAELQSIDKEKIGYIDKDVLDKRLKNNEEYLCYRCFRLHNYNELNKVVISEDEFLRNTKTVTKDALICNIIDVFDLEGTVIKNINELFPNNKILIIANKYDLFMRSNRPTKLKKYINDYLSKINVTVSGVIVTSSSDLKGIDKLYSSLINTCKALSIPDNTIYMFGVSNVGKSSLIKALLSVTNTKSNLVISNAVSTTLANNLIKVGDLNIYDTPGIINKKQITYYLDKETLDFALPKKFVKPKVWQINPGQVIFVEGFGAFIYNGLNKVSIVTYFSNMLKIHRTKELNIDNLFNNEELFRFPNADEKKRLGKLKEIKFTSVRDSEISLSGLGFIAFFGEGDITVKTYENISVEKREQLI